MRHVRPADARHAAPTTPDPSVTSATSRPTPTRPGPGGPRHAAPGRTRRAGGALRHGLLATAAAGAVALPVVAAVLTQSSPGAEAAPRPFSVQEGTRVVDLSAHLAAYEARTNADVGAQMTAAAAQVAAEQAAAEAAAAAAARAAEEQAAAERASRSRQLEADAAAAAAADADPRAVAQQLLAARGWSGQFSCLDKLWQKESGWNTHADNPSSSAYGIPQALPGSKMASAGADWQTSARTQITWGLSYIASSYGSPCSAWSHSQSHNWY